MITTSPDPRQSARRRWQDEMTAAVSAPESLVTALGLPPALAPQAAQASAAFALRVPQSFVRRMRPGDADDPLLRQVLPQARELSPPPPGYGPDPLGERTAARAPGLLQKYRGRALLITTGACAVHCRYCFRREFPYDAQHAGAPRFAAALREIAGDASLEEVILSAGIRCRCRPRAWHPSPTLLQASGTCAGCASTRALRWCCPRGSMTSSLPGSLR